VSPRKAPVRRCSWRHCSQPAAAEVRFDLPKLLAGSHRDYCAAHTEVVSNAPGTRVVRRLGRPVATQPALTGLTSESARWDPPKPGGKEAMP
jgi:hypothetical protein